jgi:hypothetical protein
VMEASRRRRRALRGVARSTAPRRGRADPPPLPSPAGAFRSWRDAGGERAHAARPRALPYELAGASSRGRARRASAGTGRVRPRRSQRSCSRRAPFRGDDAAPPSPPHRRRIPCAPIGQRSAMDDFAASSPDAPARASQVAGWLMLRCPSSSTHSTS